MNSGMVPNHLIIGARTGFLRSIKDVPVQWQRIAMQINLDAKSNDLVDLGAAPMPKRSKTGLTMQDFTERALRVTAVDWDITVHVTFNAVQDDQTGQLYQRVASAGDNFNRHLNKIVFDALNDGANTANYGATYDGLSLFNANHVDKGAAYTTVQSNVNTLPLTQDNFRTVYVAGSTRLDDNGEQTGYVPTLLVVPPALEWDAAQIATNAMSSGTANNDKNPYAGKIEYIVSPYLDSTSWYLIDPTAPIKPIILVMRQQPFLQDYWFDAEKPDGGWYCFKFFARYNAAFGEWRLATQGNT